MNKPIAPATSPPRDRPRIQAFASSGQTGKRTPEARRPAVRALFALIAVLVLPLAWCSPAAAAVHAAAVSHAAGPVLAVNDLPTVISGATTWLVGILAVLATFFLTLGGAKYLASGGDPAEVEKAKGALRNAGIGYALALLAPVLLTILQSILGV